MPSLSRFLLESPSEMTSTMRPVFGRKVRQAITSTDEAFALRTSMGQVKVTSEIAAEDRLVWEASFAHCAYDHRYYELIQKALGSQIKHHFLILLDQLGQTRAIQPFLLVNQDLTEGTSRSIKSTTTAIRRYFPSALKLRVLMIGCSAGEGHLARDVVEGNQRWIVLALREALRPLARRLSASLIVFKDFPSIYREQMKVLTQREYVRIPSMPASKLSLDFKNFDHYCRTKISEKTRKNLQRKFKKIASYEPLTMEVRKDVGPIVDELFPLYQQVVDRARYRFEELTPEYFAELGRRLSDRAIFFIWRLKGRAVAFCSCLGHEGELRDNYIGLDYKVALDYHLYFTTWRDIITWCLDHSYHTYYSAPLNYEPKYHLRQALVPLDLYVQAASGWLNPLLRKALPTWSQLATTR